MSIAEALRHRHAERLEGFVRHELFRRIEEGRLDAAARDAYFVYEHRFVEQAVVVLGHILTKAPAPSRKHLVSILNGLVTEQFDIFERILGRIGRPALRMPEAVEDFCEGMTALAREGGYAEGLAAMFAAEWTYAQVSRRLGEASLADPLLRDWFALHRQPAFLAGVAWLEAELDQAVAGPLPDAVSEAFLRAIELEIGFHAAPLARTGRP